MQSGSHLQVLIPIFLVGVACLIPLVNLKRPGLSQTIALMAVTVSLIASATLFMRILNTPAGYLDYFLGHSWNGDTLLSGSQPIGIVQRGDIFGGIMLMLVNGIGLLVTIYSGQYIPHEVDKNRIVYYYTMLVLMLAGMSGITLTGDCFNFYVFLEVATISSYVLVAIPADKKSLEASFKYMLMGALGSILVVFGIVLLFSATGTLNMAYAASQIEKIMTAPEGSSLANLKQLVYASMGLFTIGFGIKSAFFPTHAWLADAHPAAPSSISALLSGLVVKTTGIFLLIRFLFSVFNIHKYPYGDLLKVIFLVVATITTIGGSLFAIAQKDLKRMLAYSTISQMGYILIGIGFVTPIGLSAAILQMVNHAISKSLLFLCAGALIWKTGIRDIHKMGKIGHKMPLTMTCFTVGAMSLVGVPPLSGFMAKWALAEAAMDSKLMIMVGILLLSSLLNAIYYFRVVGIAFFGVAAPTETVTESVGKSEIPFTMAIPLVILASGTVYLGIKVGMMEQVISKAVHLLWL